MPLKFPPKADTNSAFSRRTYALNFKKKCPLNRISTVSF